MTIRTLCTSISVTVSALTERTTCIIFVLLHLPFHTMITIPIATQMMGPGVRTPTHGKSHVAIGMDTEPPPPSCEREVHTALCEIRFGLNKNVVPNGTKFER